MKQVLVKGGQVSVEEVPAPSMSPGMVLVRVRHSLISSGTESGFVSQGGLASYAMKKAKDPLNIEKVKRKIASVGLKGTLEIIRGKLLEFQAPGYSTSGVVVGVGRDVPGLRVGDPVACAGVGYACHAEFNAVPHQLVTPVPEGVGLDEAAFVTLGAIAMQGVRQAMPTFGETVVILGLGLIGQLAAQIARAAGCHVIGCDPVGSKRQLAMDLGAETICGPDQIEQVVREWTGGHGADAVIVCAASTESQVTNQAAELCRQKGRVAVIGAVGLHLQREPLYMKELDFRLSCSYGPGRYQPEYEERGLDYPIGYVRWTEGRNMSEFLRMIALGRVQVKQLISAIAPVDSATDAYNTILRGEAIAALIDYGEFDAASVQAPVSSLSLRKASSAAADVGVAVIGAGSFASAYHLPSLSKISGVSIEAVCARTGSKAKQAGEKAGARYCTTAYAEVLADPRVHAVVIATRHNLHAEMAIAAAKAGKHIFVEKPLALTTEDALAVQEAVNEAGVLLSIGYNRRFSPHSIALKKALKNIAGPRVMLYRCNAGPLPVGHWALDPIEGGGRIRGEAVHFFDWCCWLAGTEVVSVRADRIDSENAAQPAEDNLSTLIRFEDGSLATIVYTSLGHAEMGKERIEVFAGGGSAVIEDFRETTFHHLPSENIRARAEDKGQFGVMENFIRAIQGKEELRVTLADGVRATRIACDALASAASGLPA